ncbi:hypothetical protein F5B19DRAFT_473158 [Rostrohypoxylon terebratum]|nr:hypothetical protein F5B19DRAFT_473158 [Rostrohypoxylon terebratum]
MEEVNFTTSSSAEPEHPTPVAQTSNNATQATTNAAPIRTNVNDSVPRNQKFSMDDLFNAIESDSIEKIEEILKCNPDMLNMQNNPEAPRPLQETLNEGKLGNLLTQDILHCLDTSRIDSSMGLFEYLQLQGTDVSDYTYGKQCPLHVACIFGKSEVVRHLLEYPEIDLNVINGSQETPLGVACRAARFPIAELLLEKSRSYKEPDKGENVENKIIHVAQEDDVGNTPITYLAYRGVYPLWTKAQEPSKEDLEKLVELILKASNNDPFIESTEFGGFCLRTASVSGNTDLLEIMLELAPKCIDFQDDRGWTALHHAILWNEDQAIEKLLGAHANVHLGTIEPLTLNLLDFAALFAPSQISTIENKISHDKRQESYYKFSGNLKTLVWPENVIADQDSKMAGKSSSIGELELSKLVENFGIVKGKAEQKKLIWCHLPANDWHWVEDLCKAGAPIDGMTPSKKAPQDQNQVRLLDRLQNLFGSTKRQPPFCEPHFNEYRDSFDLVTVLPVIDIDILGGFQGPSGDKNQQCAKDVLDLYNNQTSGLHPPRTLDHYYHVNLDPKGLRKLNESQVITRYLEKCRNQKPSPQIGKVDQPSANDRHTRIPLVKYFHQFCHIITEHMERYHIHRKGPQREEASRSSTSKARSIDEPNTYAASPQMENQNINHPSQSAQSEKGHPDAEKNLNNKKHPILVVAQLWLIKTDNILLTSFPRRRGAEQNKRDPQLVERFMPLFRSKVDNLSILLHEMVRSSMAHQPSIMVDGESITYLKIFSKEVLRVAYEVDDCYDKFKSHLGNSDQNFSTLSQTSMECLMDINDVLTEIDIIKHVLHDQYDIWKKMHATSHEDQKLSTGSTDVPGKSCKWGISSCDPPKDEHPLHGDAGKIEASAKVVQGKVNDLVSLLQGQAGTENALKASEQARYLAIFTVLTVIFSPLSFVTSLLALQVESFTSNPWARGQVATACVVSVVVTIALCGLPFLWMKQVSGNDQGMKRPPREKGD